MRRHACPTTVYLVRKVGWTWAMVQNTLLVLAHVFGYGIFLVPGVCDAPTVSAPDLVLDCLYLSMFMLPFSCTTIIGLSILLSCMSADAPSSSFTICLQSEACAHAQRGIQAQFWPAAHCSISPKSWVMCFWIQLPSVVSVGRV